MRQDCAALALAGHVTREPRIARSDLLLQSAEPWLDIEQLVLLERGFDRNQETLQMRTFLFEAQAHRGKRLRREGNDAAHVLVSVRRAACVSLGQGR